MITQCNYGDQFLAQLANDLTELADMATGLPEVVTREDLSRHTWLALIVLAADSISNRIDRDDLEWLKWRVGNNTL